MIAAIKTPHVDWFALSPELALLGVSSICLLAAVLVPRALRKPVSAFLCAGGFAGSFVAAALLYAHSDAGQTIIGGAIRRDQYAALAQMILAGAGLLTVGVSYAQRSRDTHVAEYYSLLAAAGGGMAFLAAAENLMTLFLALEWFSICLYILCALEVELVGSLESGLKYLIVGSFGSGFLLFGSALVYGATGHLGFRDIAAAVGARDLSSDYLLVTGLAMILVGLCFKASAAPFHQWTPDVYEGAPTPVTAFMAAATKTVALVLMLRVLVEAFPQEAHLWTVALATVATISLAVGNFGALLQRNVKRMLAYSSISHAGFMLIGVSADSALGARALLYYLIPYAAMTIGAFAVVAARERELGRPVTLDNLGGMGWERPFLGVSMGIFMFGMAGLPPGGTFVGKFYVFAAAYRHGWTWLVIVGCVATAVSIYYYLGVIRAMFMRAAPGTVAREPVVAGGAPPRETLLQASVLACAVVSVGSLIVVQPLIDFARHAAQALPF